MHEPLVTELAAAPNVVADLVESLPVGLLTQSPTGEGWTITDVIGHMRAADAIWTPRILVALVHDGAPMPDVDERVLQTVMHASGLLLGDQLTSYAFGRAELCGVLDALTEDEWSHTFTHAERGHVTVIDACTVVARHEAEHLEQMRTIAAGLRASFEPGQ